MIYLLPCAGSYASFSVSSGKTVEMPRSKIGCLATPSTGIPQAVIEGYTWGGDNEAFTRAFDPDRFFGWLDRMVPYQDTCKFVACPDVVGDAGRTHELWAQWSPLIHMRGFLVAFVAQDGQERHAIPDNAAALFVGGSTEWKLSGAARDIIRQAKARGLWVHVGRVNGAGRFGAFRSYGADSADGTYITFERNKRWAKILGWVGQKVMSL